MPEAQSDDISSLILRGSPLSALDFVYFTDVFACAPGEPEYESVDCSVLLLCALMMSTRERAEAETVVINSVTFSKPTRSLHS